MARPSRSPASGEEGYTAEEHEFLKAVQAYQKRTRRKFLTHVELLRIAKEMGYTRPIPSPVTTAKQPA